MLEPILGSVNCERVLLFILARGEGYGRQIARFFETDLDPIQKQLDKLQLGGVLNTRVEDRKLVFSFNPDYPLLDALKALLEEALALQPIAFQEQLSRGGGH